MPKPFTAELGNLTPIIVVPGRWSEGDLDYHADNIVTMLTNNAGFNCTTSRVIVTAAPWPQRGGAHGPDPPPARRAADAPRVLPGRRARFEAFGRGPPRGGAVRQPGRRTPAVDARRRTSRRTPRATRATASRRSAA